MRLNGTIIFPLGWIKYHAMLCLKKNFPFIFLCKRIPDRGLPPFQDYFRIISGIIVKDRLHCVTHRLVSPAWLVWRSSVSRWRPHHFLLTRQTGSLFHAPDLTQGAGSWSFPLWPPSPTCLCPWWTSQWCSDGSWNRHCSEAGSILGSGHPWQYFWPGLMPAHQEHLKVNSCIRKFLLSEIWSHGLQEGNKSNI